MREVFIFRPPRRTGIIVHGVAIIILGGLGALGIWKASLSESGPSFLIYLLGAILAIAFLPGLVYRVYALQQARYVLARDGIKLYWGLRREEIPIDSISWVVSVTQNQMNLAKPFLRIPGAILGVQTQANGIPVEFLAARDTNLVVIVTSNRSFAISPANETEFLNTYRRLAEFGSLAPIQSASDYPAFLLARSWADQPGTYPADHQRSPGIRADCVGELEHTRPPTDCIEIECGWYSARFCTRDTTAASAGIKHIFLHRRSALGVILLPSERYPGPWAT